MALGLRNVCALPRSACMNERDVFLKNKLEIIAGGACRGEADNDMTFLP